MTTTGKIFKSAVLAASLTFGASGWAQQSTTTTNTQSGTNTAVPTSPAAPTTDVQVNQDSQHRGKKDLREGEGSGARTIEAGVRDPGDLKHERKEEKKDAKRNTLEEHREDSAGGKQERAERRKTDDHNLSLTNRDPILIDQKDRDKDKDKPKAKDKDHDGDQH